MEVRVPIISPQPGEPAFTLPSPRVDDLRALVLLDLGQLTPARGAELVVALGVAKVG